MHSEPAGAKQPKQLTCETCSTLFTSKRHWQRFCSDKCRNDYHHRLTPESLRRDLDAMRAELAALKNGNEALSRRVDELEAAVAKVPA
jgi:protein-arginine kinase activator protein McsA